MSTSRKWRRPHSVVSPVNRCPQSDEPKGPGWNREAPNRTSSNMVPIPAARWVLLRLLRKPASWIMLAGVAGLVPVLWAMAPLDGLHGGCGPESMAHAWAMPIAVLAGIVGLFSLRTIDDFLRYLPPLTRVIIETASVFLLGVTLHGLLFGGAWAVDDVGFLYRASPHLVQALLIDLQVAMVCAVSIHIRLSPLPGTVLLVLVAWVLPAVFPEFPLSLPGGMEVSEHDHVSQESSLSPTSMLGALRICGALGLAAWLLIVPRQRAPRCTQ